MQDLAKQFLISSKLNLLTDIARTANKGFAIAGVSCSADIFVQGGSSVLRMKFSAKNPRLRKALKRCAKPIKSKWTQHEGIHSTFLCVSGNSVTTLQTLKI